MEHSIRRAGVYTWSQTVIPLLMVIIYSYFVRPLFVIRYMTFFLPLDTTYFSVNFRINDLIFSGRQEIIEEKLDSVPVFFMAVVIVTVEFRTLIA